MLAGATSDAERRVSYNPILEMHTQRRVLYLWEHVCFSRKEAGLKRVS